MVGMLILNILTDFYLYRIAKSRTKGTALKNIQLYSSVCLYLFIIVTICLPRRSGDDSELRAIMWMLFAYFSIYIPKYIFIIFDLISLIPELAHHKRIKIVSIIGGIISVVVFLLMWWGALINRFSIDVKTVNVEIENLPDEFNGFTILQFSDFHVGTYGNDTIFVQQVVDEINSIKPDLIVFTGDIVNRRTSELIPFIKVLSQLHAKYGVYSILGNHDYGDYSVWPDEAAKAANMDSLYKFNDMMGWKLLLNSHEWIKKGNDSIAIIGVENIGDPPFPKYGSLEKAYLNLSDSQTKILLSHNPAHWVDDISKSDTINIALTLSGHTHAMQIAFLGFSPAEWRYPTWGGMYADQANRKKLYVNIGLGTVGIPMRIGATPELTLFTLHTVN